MQKAMKEGRVTSHELVAQYLLRLGLYQQMLHAAITVNPNALKDADMRDRERAQGHIRGPLHGIPLALKDNILTTNIPTSGGTIAFFGFTPPYEATLTKNLEDAGAVIIAKTGMSELANWMATGMLRRLQREPAGQGYNPYDPRKVIRAKPHSMADRSCKPVGRASGIGTAANLWAGNVGTETSGSVLSPSNANMLAAVKPTVGRGQPLGHHSGNVGSGHRRPHGKSPVSDVAIM